MPSHLRALVPLSLAIATLAPMAHAQNDAAGAEALYRAAIDLMAAGKYGEACPKLEDSERMDPQAGTLFKLGECYEGAGKYASAWAKYAEALESKGVVGNAERTAMVKARVARVEPRVSKLTIVVPEAVAGLGELVVKRDGVMIGAGSWGVGLPVDAGQHVVEATAKGKQRWVAAIQVGVQSTASVAVPNLVEEARAADPVPVGSSAPASQANAQVAAPASTRMRSEQEEAPGSTERVLGYSALALAAVGAGLGVAFEVQRSNTLSAQDTSPCKIDRLPDGTYPSSTACLKGSAVQADYNQRDTDARAASRNAAISFVAAGVLGVAGAVLLVTAPSRDVAWSPAPLAVAGGGGLGVVGRW